MRELTQLQLGSPVRCNDGPARHASVAVSAEGDEIGKVDGFLVADTRLTHVLLHDTRLSDTGTATLPIESVTALETDRITVSLT